MLRAKVWLGEGVDRNEEGSLWGPGRIVCRKQGSKCKALARSRLR